jgi:hypothetical protein
MTHCITKGSHRHEVKIGRDAWEVQNWESIKSSYEPGKATVNIVAADFTEGRRIKVGIPSGGWINTISGLLFNCL